MSLVFIIIFSFSCSSYILKDVTELTLTPTSTLTPTPTSLDVLITLERTRCFGACPAYRLTIAGDGTVVYEGYYFVKVEGSRASIITQQQLEELIHEFERVDYFSFTDYIDYHATDMPSAITSITINGRTKTVEHYFGDFNAPNELIELENKIDEITNSSQWVGE